MSKAKLATALLASLSEKQTKKINIPEFEGDIYIRQITVGEQAELVETVEQGKASDLATTFIFGVCDENGNRLFSLDDLEQVNKINFHTMMKIAKEINQFNGVTKDDVDYEKNS